MTSKYYVPSQQSSATGFFSIFLGMAILGSAVSIPYLFLIRVCPNIKLTVIITVLTGLGLGWMAGLLCKVFKIRNVAVALIAVTLGYVFFTYFKWIFYVSYIASDYYEGAASYVSYAPALITHPLDFIQMIGAINQEGTWSMSSSHTSSASSASAVNGILLGIIWFAEIALLYLCILFPVISQARKPFIESEGKWAVKYPKTFALPYFQAKTRISDLEMNPTGVIRSLDPKAFSQRNYTEITLFHSGDYTENYIDINEIALDNRNRKTAKTTVKKLRVDYEFADALLQMFHYNK